MSTRYLLCLLLGALLFGCSGKKETRNLPNGFRIEKERVTERAWCWRLLRQVGNTKEVITEGVAVGGRLQTFWPTPFEGAGGPGFDGGGYLHTVYSCTGPSMLRITMAKHGGAVQYGPTRDETKLQEFLGSLTALMPPGRIGILVVLEVALPADLKRLEDAIEKLAGINPTLILVPQGAYALPSRSLPDDLKKVESRPGQADPPNAPELAPRGR